MSEINIKENIDIKLKVDLNSIYSLRSYLLNISLINKLEIDLNEKLSEFFIKFHFITIEDYINIKDIFIKNILGNKIVINKFDLTINKDKFKEIKGIKKGFLFIEIIKNNRIYSYLKLSISLYPFYYIDLNHFPIETLVTFLELNNDFLNEDIKLIKDNYFNKLKKSIETIYGLNFDDNLALINEEIKLFNNKNLFYLNLPIKYLENGINIKSIEEINKTKKCTSLDLSLYFVSILIYFKLNPILILINNKIFIGIWTYNEHFLTSVNNDYNLLNSFISIDRILLIDSESLFKKGESIKDNSLKIKEYIKKYQNELTYIDIRSAFSNNYLPLSDELSLDLNIENLKEESNLEKLKNKDRYKYYLTKLMDFSKSNKLMNYKLGSRSIELILTIEDFNYIFNNKISLKLVSNFEETLIKKKPINYKKNNEFNIISNNLIKQNELEVYLEKKEYYQLLTSLYKKTKFEIDESGTNSLFISFGLFSYLENKVTYFAPLLLFPVSLIKKDKSYYLSFLDQDINLNLTFLTYLKDTYNIDLTYLKENLEGFNKENYLNLDNLILEIKNKLKENKDINIYSNFYLGRFSFKKLIIYNDLILNKDKLFLNPITKSFLEGKNYLERDNKPFLTSFEIDKYLTFSDYSIPLSYDSSELEAIINSNNKNSFILIGPPGTGKSQTIANTIFNLISNDKTVLFCSEKKAALDVVYERLKEAKIDNFILELHSNKVNKSEVLNSFEKLFELGQIDNNKSYKLLVSNLDIEKNALKEKIEFVHNKEENKLSLYEAMLNDLSVSFKEERIFLDKEFIDNYSAKKIEEVKELLSNTESLILNLKEDYLEHFNIYKNKNYSLEYRNKLKETLDLTLNNLSLFLDIEEKIKNILHYDLTLNNEFINIFSLFNTNTIYLNLITNEYSIKKISRYIDLINNEKEYFNKKNYLKSKLNKEILSLSLDKLIKLKEGIISKNKIIKNVNKLKLERLINKYKLDNLNLNYFDLLTDLIFIKEKENLIKENHNLISINLNDPDFNSYDESINFDFNLILNNLNKTRLFYEKIKSLETNEFIYKDLFNNFNELIKNNLNIKLINSYLDLYVSINNKLDILENNYYFDFSLINKEDYFKKIYEKLTYINNNINDLYRYSYLLVILDRLKEYKLNVLLDLFLNKKYSYLRIKNIFLFNIYKDIIDEKLANEHLFKNKTNNFNALQSNFNKDFKKYQEISVIETISKLTKKIELSNYSYSNEYSLLKKYIKSNGKGMSIREFLNLIPNLILRMKPCVLVSPLSLAKYLTSPKYHFDVVIFDEASQIRTYEALPSLNKADSFIICGDNKQLPPTSFFDKQNEDYKEDLFIKELDSILDDSLLLNFKKERLLYHYRSKNESLISFSNSHFYNNELITFPSTSVNETKVKIVYVNNGIYDIGRSNTNLIEAKKLVSDLISYIKENKDKTYGIITFSIHQMELIDKLIEEEVYKDNELRKIIANLKEDLFIKNLENVQGDERDIIFISLCYAKNKNGKFILNFGPLNNLGGERRLNVLLTRSKEELYFYTSIRANEINLNRTNSIGVRYLKEFLEYSLNYENNINLKDSFFNENPLISDIKNELTNLGYKVNINIGKSKFKIDLGIINPINENEYILGILLDNESYYNNKNEIDRNIVKLDSLINLGRNIYFIFSLSYYLNKEKIIKEIKEKLDVLIDEKKMNINLTDTNKKSKLNIELVKINKEDYKYFKKYARITLKNYYTIENLLDLRNKEIIYKLIKDIIEIESPISKSLLIKRIYELFSIKRKNKKVNEIILYYLSKLNNYKNLGFNNENYFYFKDIVLNESDARTYTNFYRKKSNREIEEISKEELRFVIKEILERYISLDKKELKKEIIKRLSFKSITKKIDDILEFTLNYLIKETKEIAIKDNNIYLI